MGHAPRSIAESRQVASSEIRRLKASPAGSSIERKAGRRRDRRGSHACVHVTLNEVTGYGDDCANYRPAARARPERQCQHDRGEAARRTDAE